MEQVSIILPTYNRASCIGAAVESIIRQTYPAWELLVIDDGSVDDTEEIVMGFASSDDRVRYRRQPRNHGVSAARNEGIRQARYDYIAFQDSDDIWHSDKLEKQMRVFAKRPQAGLVYCGIRGTGHDGRPILIPDAEMDRGLLQGDLYSLLLQGNVIDCPAAVIRRECTDKCGGFDETLSCLEDWELFLRIAAEYEIGYVDEALVDSDIHNEGVSSRVGGYFEARCRMIALHRKALLEYDLFNGVVERLFFMAKEAGALEQVAKMLQGLLVSNF